MENNWWFLKKLKIELIISSGNSISEYIPKGNEKGISKRYRYSHVYYNINHNSQQMETT